ncbi:hypothetical protein PZA11_007858 [Diplocarpon coronariae]
MRAITVPTTYLYDGALLDGKNGIENVVKPLLKGEPDQAIIDAQAPRWNQLASILDVQLARTKWLAGNETTIADIAVPSRMHIHKASVVPLDKHSNLKYLMQETVKLPYWGKTQGMQMLPSHQIIFGKLVRDSVLSSKLANIGAIEEALLPGVTARFDVCLA